MKTSDQPRNPAATAGTPAADPSQVRPGLLPPLNRRDFDRAGKLSSNVSMAVTALWANRLRSLLTTLGIFIGVAAVIAVLSLVQGVGASISTSISSLGTNTIFIAPSSNNKTSGGDMNPTGSVSAAATTPLTLTPGDARAITTGPIRIADVTAVCPIIVMNEEVSADNQNWSTSVQGVETTFQSIRNVSIQEGKWFSSSDEQAARLVAVLGQTVSQQLFADRGQDPMSKTIRIGSVVYQVVGVLVPIGQASADDAVYVPFTTAQERLRNNGYVDQILVQVDDSNTLGTVQQAITSLLEQRHHIRQGMTDDFTLTTSAQVVGNFNQTLDLLATLWGGIASISLVVGGIGIMNIMLVSVTERTREIGVRLSLGAGRQDIRNQFLIEALILSLAGGVIGLLLGSMLGYGITVGLLGVPFALTPLTLLLPFVVSASIGIIFGYYPAARASRLDPIEALRSL